MGRAAGIARACRRVGQQLLTASTIAAALRPRR